MPAGGNRPAVFLFYKKQLRMKQGMDYDLFIFPVYDECVRRNRLRTEKEC